MTPNEDYFALFGLERQYPLDRARLDESYERLSLEHHPDFFSTGSAEEKAQAHRISAQLNEGYRVLTSELGRAAYLLQLLAQGRELDTKALPEGFLQQMFLIQEEVDELETSGDDSLKAELKSQTESKLHDVRAERERLFRQAQGNEDATTLQAIQSNINSERYLNRLLERLR